MENSRALSFFHPNRSRLENFIYIYRNNVWVTTKISCSGAATIVGNPWGKMHYRLMGLAVAPFGKMVAR